MNDILNLSDEPIFDNSIESYEYTAFLPTTKSNFNDSGQTIGIGPRCTSSRWLLQTFR